MSELKQKKRITRASKFGSWLYYKIEGSKWTPLIGLVFLGFGGFLIFTWGHTNILAVIVAATCLILVGIFAAIVDNRPSEESLGI